MIWPQEVWKGPGLSLWKSWGTDQNVRERKGHLKFTHPDSFSHCLTSSNLAEMVRFLAELKKTRYMNNSTADRPLWQSHVIDKPVHSHNPLMQRQKPREGKEPARTPQLIAGTAVTGTQVLWFRAQGSPHYNRHFLPTITAAGLEHIFIISCNRHNK